MKKLFFLFILMLSPMLASAQTVSDIQNSGCLSETRGEDSQKIPTIVLTKEGSTLSVQLLNYEENCGTTDFIVTPKVSTNESEPCIVTVKVDPVIPQGYWCICPFNVSFSVHDLEPNSFYLDCWWYKGMVELTDGVQLALENNNPNTPKYFPTGMTWEEIVVDPYMEQENVNARIYEIGTDTIIGDITYKKVLKDNVFSGLCVRESGDKVWLLAKEYPTEILLYNFDWDSNPEIVTEYLKGQPHMVQDEEEYEVRQETIPVGDSKTVEIEGQTYQYIMKRLSGTLIRGIGKVAELNRYPCLLSYREPYQIAPGLDYHKVHWIKRNGVEIFRSESAREWTNEIPTGDGIDVPHTDFYYNGYYNSYAKIPLTLNESKVCVSIYKDNKNVSERIRANVHALYSTTDEFFDIFLITRSDLEKLTSLDFWEEEAKSVIITPCYYIGDMEKDLREVFSTPYLVVQLKKEEDMGLLTSYAENYQLKIVGSIGRNNLFTYSLHVTSESEKSPLECANEMFESGDFLVSYPDFVYADYGIEDDYRPFVEEGKVWKVGSTIGISENLVKMVEYYYFDGDTIIDGKTCKQMMCQRYFSPDFSDDYWTPLPSLSKVGAWYEEDKKVYNYTTVGKQFMTMYDFSLEANETLDFVLSQYDGCPPCIIGPKQTEGLKGLKGFKGVYRDIMWLEGEGTNYCTTWLEGVGGIDGPTVNIYYGEEGHALFLMSCTVGDEVIYHNDEYEDGTTPADARKKRFDFTHTIKIGEYNDQQLGIHLDPLDDDYLVNITDESGKVVYEKTIHAGSIVGLNIDISAYAEGSYTVTVENSQESFTGMFETQTTGIKEIRNNKEEIRTEIYNLQGQRLNTLQKGLNIVNGKKIIMTHDNYDK